MLSIVRGKGPQPQENSQLWACASRLQDYKTGEGLIESSPHWHAGCRMLRTTCKAQPKEKMTETCDMRLRLVCRQGHLLVPSC